MPKKTKNEKNKKSCQKRENSKNKYFGTLFDMSAQGKTRAKKHGEMKRIPDIFLMKRPLRSGNRKKTSENFTLFSC